MPSSASTHAERNRLGGVGAREADTTSIPQLGKGVPDSVGLLQRPKTTGKTGGIVWSQRLSVPGQVYKVSRSSSAVEESRTRWLARLKIGSLYFKPLHLLLVLLNSILDTGIHHGLCEDPIFRGICHGLEGRGHRRRGWLLA